jgi:hypothetical protein
MDYKINNNLLKILDYNLKCYEFQNFKFENGLFDETVDATYVINLVGNGRYESVYNQLLEYKPSNEVFILLNQGYKKCNKSKHIIYPADDLNDAFFQIFRHANDKNYENILILEDDFIFTEEIKNKKHINSINNFLKKKQGTDFIYYIGCFPFLMLPNLSDIKHFHNLKSSGMHSVIYSKKMRQHIMDNYKDPLFKYKDWDFNANFLKNRYAYYKYLCYQLYPETENSKYWLNFNPIIFTINKFVSKSAIKAFKMDTQIEPGCSIIYGFSKSIIFILAIIFIYFIVTIIKKSNLNKV